MGLPFKHKGIMCAPMISEITLDTYLKTGDFEIVLVDGENYEGNRPLYYDWVKRLYEVDTKISNTIAEKEKAEKQQEYENNPNNIWVMVFPYM